MVLQQKPHARFKRTRDDLAVVAKISLLEALTGNYCRCESVTFVPRTFQALLSSSNTLTIVGSKSRVNRVLYITHRACSLLAEKLVVHLTNYKWVLTEVLTTF